ncbi:MAG: acylphosphatase [Cyclobacteriaceae bacterium]
MQGKRIQVFGKVQGVFFRATTKTKADDLKLKGWVRNESDGSVMIEVEGSVDGIGTFITWCHDGPTFARVDKVTEEDISVRDYSDFEIRY